MFRQIKLEHFGIIALLALTLSCVESPNFSEIPEITFLGLSKDTLDQGVFQEDSLSVFFSFTDGDGDLGATAEEGDRNLFFVDMRTGFEDNTFRLPLIPAEGSSNGIEGTARIVLFSTCCIYPMNGPDPCTPSSTFPLDTVQYQITLVDRAGNRSNEIMTTPIILRCN